MPRYQLFFQNLQKLNRDEAAQQPIDQVLESIKHAAETINASIAVHEEREKVREVAERVGLDDVFQPHRKLVKEGTMVKLCRKEDKFRAVFLFNDSFLYASMNLLNETLMLPKLYQLKGCSCEADPKIETQLSLSTAKKSFILKCRSKAERDAWVTDIII